MEIFSAKRLVRDLPLVVAYVVLWAALSTAWLHSACPWISWASKHLSGMRLRCSNTSWAALEVAALSRSTIGQSWGRWPA